MEYEDEDKGDEAVPGLLVDWDFDALTLLVEKTNIVSQESEVPKPDWLSQTGGRISLNSFIRGVIRALQAAAGGVKVVKTLPETTP